MNLKKIALGAAVALACATGAQAAVETNTYFVTSSDSGVNGDLRQIFYFGNYTDAAVAGDTFVDNFVFNTPSALSSLQFVAASDLGANLTSYSLAPAGAGEPVVFKSQLATSNFFAATGANVISGVYDLQITGTYVVNGGILGGQIYTNAVPEPSAPLLALAGLGVLGLAARRRAKRG